MKNSKTAREIASRIPKPKIPTQAEIDVMQQQFLSENQRNCLSYWYPKIRDVVPTPKTEFVTIENGWRMGVVLDGELSPEFEETVHKVTAMAERMGYPCFLRTGHLSGKHDWNSTCFLTYPDNVRRHVIGLIESSHLAGFLGLPHDVWVVRELLPVSPLFRCLSYGHMPVVREWRAFVDEERVVYGIPYWPEEALADGKPDDPAWKNRLPELHTEPAAEVLELAARVGKAVGGQWSVDLLETRNGWFVTDMAEACLSYGFDPERFQQ